ncbi:MAG: DUF4956 domain-containing protein [Bacteroidetes bacterium]|nr:DUF4956 domain-containing protein [Bacteroidota bacterium]
MDLFTSFNSIFFVRIGIDLLLMWVLIRGIYFTHYKRSDLFLTFFAFNLVIFLITYMLNEVEMTLGAAFGLFAIFSMLRFRTENISAKDMTYIFIVIALGLIMAISKATWMELLALGTFIILLTLLFDSNLLIRQEISQAIYYDRVDLIQPSSREALLDDLRNRTGLSITRIEIGDIDLLRDTVKITIFYSRKS